jgi:hypothetical protein
MSTNWLPMTPKSTNTDLIAQNLNSIDSIMHKIISYGTSNTQSKNHSDKSFNFSKLCMLDMHKTHTTMIKNLFLLHTSENPYSISEKKEMKLQMSLLKQETQSSKHLKHTKKSSAWNEKWISINISFLHLAAQRHMVATCFFSSTATPHHVCIDIQEKKNYWRRNGWKKKRK